MKTLLAVLLVAPLLSVSAGAAEVRILSAGAAEPAMEPCAQLVKRANGDEIKAQFNTAPQIARRLAAGEEFDILIAPPDTITQAVKDGKVAADTRVTVGSVGAGVVVRNGAPAPDISTADALKRSLLAADSVVYNSASSGLYLEKLFEKMGILDQLKAKTTRYPGGNEVMSHLSKGKGNEIGFGAITEIKAFEQKGVRFVGPLPADVQNYTRYEAALMTEARSRDEAKAVLRQIASPAGKALFVASGME